MGIDRIGKGGGVPAPDAGAVGGPSEAGATGKSFEVAPSKVASAEASDPTSPLARLRAGEIDAKGYVDLEVDAATRGLEGLPPGDLAEIKKVLRDQMMTDPGLSDLLRQATGQAPPTPEE